jgi:hypothetical protein
MRPDWHLGALRYLESMGELFRTNEHGLLNVVEGLLTGADIPYHIADQHMSVVEGSINMFMMRILVPDKYEEEARQLLIDAELGHWLRT